MPTWESPTYTSVYLPTTCLRKLQPDLVAAAFSPKSFQSRMAAVQTGEKLSCDGNHAMKAKDLLYYNSLADKHISKYKKQKGVQKHLKRMGFLAVDGTVCPTKQEQIEANRVNHLLKESKEMLRKLNKREKSHLRHLSAFARAGEVTFTKDGVYENGDRYVYRKVASRLNNCPSSCPCRREAKLQVQEKGVSKRLLERRLPQQRGTLMQTSLMDVSHACTQTPRKHIGHTSTQMPSNQLTDRMAQTSQRVMGHTLVQTSNEQLVDRMAQTSQKVMGHTLVQTSSEQLVDRTAQTSQIFRGHTPMQIYKKQLADRRAQMSPKITSGIGVQTSHVCKPVQEVSKSSPDRFVSATTSLALTEENNKRRVITRLEKQNAMLKSRVHGQMLNQEKEALKERLKMDLNKHQSFLRTLNRLQTKLVEKELTDSKKLKTSKETFCAELKRKTALVVILNVMQEEQERIYLAFEKARLGEEQRKVDEAITEQVKTNILNELNKKQLEVKNELLKATNIDHEECLEVKEKVSTPTYKQDEANQGVYHIECTKRDIAHASDLIGSVRADLSLLFPQQSQSIQQRTSTQEVKLSKKESQVKTLPSFSDTHSMSLIATPSMAEKNVRTTRSPIKQSLGPLQSTLSTINGMWATAMKDIQTVAISESEPVEPTFQTVKRSPSPEVIYITTLHSNSPSRKDICSADLFTEDSTCKSTNTNNVGLMPSTLQQGSGSSSKEGSGKMSSKWSIQQEHGCDTSLSDKASSRQPDSDINIEHSQHSSRSSCKSDSNSVSDLNTEDGFKNTTELPCKKPVKPIGSKKGSSKSSSRWSTQWERDSDPSFSDKDDSDDVSDQPLNYVVYPPSPTSKQTYLTREYIDSQTSLKKNEKGKDPVSDYYTRKFFSSLPTTVHPNDMVMRYQKEYDTTLSEGSETTPLIQDSQNESETSTSVSLPCSLVSHSESSSITNDSIFQETENQQKENEEDVPISVTTTKISQIQFINQPSASKISKSLSPKTTSLKETPATPVVTEDASIQQIASKVSQKSLDASIQRSASKVSQKSSSNKSISSLKETPSTHAVTTDASIQPSARNVSQKPSCEEFTSSLKSLPKRCTSLRETPVTPVVTEYASIQQFTNDVLQKSVHKSLLMEPLAMNVVTEDASIQPSARNVSQKSSHKRFTSLKSPYKRSSSLRETRVTPVVTEYASIQQFTNDVLQKSVHKSSLMEPLAMNVVTEDASIQPSARNVSQKSSHKRFTSLKSPYKRSSSLRETRVTPVVTEYASIQQFTNDVLQKSVRKSSLMEPLAMNVVTEDASIQPSAMKSPYKRSSSLRETRVTPVVTEYASIQQSTSKVSQKLSHKRSTSSLKESSATHVATADTSIQQSTSKILQQSPHKRSNSLKENQAIHVVTEDTSIQQNPSKVSQKLSHKRSTSSLKGSSATHVATADTSIQQSTSKILQQSPHKRSNSLKEFPATPVVTEYDGNQQFTSNLLQKPLRSRSTSPLEESPSDDDTLRLSTIMVSNGLSSNRCTPFPKETSPVPAVSEDASIVKVISSDTSHIHMEPLQTSRKSSSGSNKSLKSLRSLMKSPILPSQVKIPQASTASRTDTAVTNGTHVFK